MSGMMKMKRESKERNVSKITMTVIDDNVLEITKGLYRIGKRENGVLEVNTYLRIFEGNGKRVKLLIDPGPPALLNDVVAGVKKVTGSATVDLIYLNHQDPDVAYNATFFQKMNPKSLVVCSEDTWRLVSLFGLDQKRYKPIEGFKNLTASLPTGDKLQFVPTPFCHFRGATALYDKSLNFLFTGDLFGGLSYESGLIAGEEHFEGVKAFHQIYMPVKEALRYAVEKIRTLPVKPQLIIPQHGKIIPEGLIDFYLNKLETLEVGLDLFKQQFDNEMWILSLNEMLMESSSILQQSLIDISNTLRGQGHIPTAITIDNRGTVTDLKIDFIDAANILITQMFAMAPPEMHEPLSFAFMKTLIMQGLPVPPILEVAQVQDAVVPAPSGMDNFLMEFDI